MGISARNFRYCSVLVAGGAVVGYWAGVQFGPPDWESDKLTSALGVVAQIAATMMGFLLAALAILASIAGMRLLRNMQRTGHYAILLTRMFISATFFFLLMLETGAALFLGERLPFAVEMMFGLIFTCCASLIEASLKLTTVLMSLKPSGAPLE